MYILKFLTLKTTRKLCCRKETVRDAAAVLFGLKVADDIQYKFKSSQASKAMLQSSKQWRKTDFNAKWRFKVI